MRRNKEENETSKKGNSPEIHEKEGLNKVIVESNRLYFYFYYRQHDTIIISRAIKVNIFLLLE